MTSFDCVGETRQRISLAFAHCVKPVELLTDPHMKFWLRRIAGIVLSIAALHLRAQMTTSSI